MGLNIDIDINSLSFLSTIVATISVIGISVYGWVRCLAFGKFFTGLGVLLLIPLWFVAQFLLWVFFDAFILPGSTHQESPFDYAVTPFLTLAGGGLILYGVIRYLRSLETSLPDDTGRQLETDAYQGAGSWFSEPRRIVGFLIVGLGVAVMSTGFFFIAGTLFVIVGVSLIMNVRIWRN